MAFTLVATPGASNANSYVSLEEAEEFAEARATVTEWEDHENQEGLLATATRVIDSVLTAGRRRVDADPPYYVIRPTWTGAPATETQALAWPRTGMTNRNGFPIASTVIPTELKQAVTELAIQLAVSDRTIDNDNAVKGITSVKAGSVSVSFADPNKIMTTKVLPDIVLMYLVPSWLTEEVIEGATSIDFEVI